MDILAEAKAVFETEIQSLSKTAQFLNENFVRLVEEIHACNGRVIVVGMGKSHHVGSKVAATMSSLGTPTFFLHPAEALHGDLGRITGNDIVLLFSKSGESEEINNMLPSIKKIGAKTFAITCRESSTLSRACNSHIMLHITKEASAHNIAPTSSTTVMMAFGDALAVCLEKLSGFTSDDYAVFHPSGALGKRLLLTVADIMAKGEDMPYVFSTASLKDAIFQMSSKSIMGGVAIVDNAFKLLGILTDGDLRRLLYKVSDISVLEKNITEVMTSDPVTYISTAKAVDALSFMENSTKAFGILPIVDDGKRLIGMLSLHDLIKTGL